LKFATAIEPSGLLVGVVQFDSEGDVDVVAVPAVTVVLVVDVVAGTVELEVDADDLVVIATGLELLAHDAAPNADSVINTISAGRHTTTRIPGLCTSSDALKSISSRPEPYDRSASPHRRSVRWISVRPT
jgi:hypothetical protein